MSPGNSIGIIHLLEDLLNVFESGEPISKETASVAAKKIRSKLNHRHVFILCEYGGQWIVGTSRKYEILKTRRQGYKYLKFIIQNPGKQFPAITVAHLGQIDGISQAMVFDQNERARVNVTKQIRSALGEITTASPEVGRHLASRISTGYYMGYLPDPANKPNWALIWNDTELEQNFHTIS